MHLTNLNLRHFEPSEFHRNGTDWFLLIDSTLLVRLDVLREFWGKPIEISSHPRAVGRFDGDSRSWHNIDVHDKVRAVDTFPSGLITHDAVSAFRDLAIRVGFCGIGYYPDWEISNRQGGFHLDTGNRIATW